MLARFNGESNDGPVKVQSFCAVSFYSLKRVHAQGAVRGADDTVTPCQLSMPVTGAVC